MLAIFDVDTGVFDVFALVAAIVFVVAAFLAKPASPAPANAYATSLAYLGLAVFSFGFLFMTP